MILRLFSLLLLTVLLPGVALSQTVDAVEEEVIPLYDVEIVLFKNTRVPQSREFVLPISSPSRPENMLDLSSMASIEAARELGYDLVATDQLRLLELVTRLINSKRYELLLHAAWRQPGLERERVLPVWIKGGRIYGNEYMSIDSQIEFIDNMAMPANGEDDAEPSLEIDEQTLESQELQMLEMQTMQAHDGLYELEGKITIVLSRYLHTFTDLVLRRPRLTADPTLENAATDAYLAAHAADTHILNNHHLKEHRRMRSKNLHYIDSPEFGMLILITPYEVVEGFEETPIEPEAETEPVASE
jgi:hypothetical protein